MKFSERAFISVAMLLLNVPLAQAMNTSVSVSADLQQNNVASIFNVPAYQSLESTGMDVSSLIYPGMKAPASYSLPGEITATTKFGITDFYEESDLFAGSATAFPNLAISSIFTENGISFDKNGNLNPLNPLNPLISLVATPGVSAAAGL